MIAIMLWLRIEDDKKLKGKYKDNEAIEFSFDLQKDVPEDVAQEMVESGYVCEADHKTMAKAIKDCVSLICRKREQRKLVQEEQEKRKQEAEQQQQLTEGTVNSGQGLSIFSECQLPMSYSSPAASHHTPQLQQQPPAQPSYPTASQTTQQHPAFPPQPMPQSLAQPYGGGGGSGVCEPALSFPSIPERPVSFSPPPSCTPKGFNVQRRRSTSILEAHTRHFQPAYRSYGSSLHPFSSMEAHETSHFLLPNVSPHRLTEHVQASTESLHSYKDIRMEQEEAVRRLSLNQAVLLDHLEAMAYSGYPITAHQLNQLTFHQQMEAAAAASLAYESPQPSPGYLHPHVPSLMRLNHSPVPQTAPVSLAQEPCYQPHPSFPHSAPPVLAHTPDPATAFEFQMHNIQAEPGVLAARLYRARRGSMELTLEEASGNTGPCNRLQPVTEELGSYTSPEMPLTPGSLLLLHAHKERSPDPSSDSVASSDTGDFHSPPQDARVWIPRSPSPFPRPRHSFIRLTEEVEHTKSILPLTTLICSSLLLSRPALISIPCRAPGPDKQASSLSLASTMLPSAYRVLLW